MFVKKRLQRLRCPAFEKDGKTFPVWLKPQTRLKILWNCMCTSAEQVKTLVTTTEGHKVMVRKEF